MPTVVVVDNSPTVKRLFEKSVGDMEIKLDFYDTAEDALPFLQSNKPELLILSIILPQKDGLSFLKELRDLPLHTDTAVIMISSKDYTQDRQAAFTLGAKDFIAKPISMQTIKDIIVKYTEV